MYARMLCHAGFTNSIARIPANVQKRDAGDAPARAAKAVLVVVFTFYGHDLKLEALLDN
jgi:hypothetical protein